MNNFTVIPVLDLKGGVAVHAVAGRRADYAPITSPFGQADDPASIARGMLAFTDDLLKERCAAYLDQLIVKLRQKIEDTPAEPRHLLTVHTLGYRLEA